MDFRHGRFGNEVKKVGTRSTQADNRNALAADAVLNRRDGGPCLKRVGYIAAYAKDMKDFQQESELTERRDFIESFVKEIIVVPGDALTRYTVPMPDDSFLEGRATEKVALDSSVLSTMHVGPLEKARTDHSGRGASPTTSRRWYCLPSNWAQQTGQDQEPSRCGSDLSPICSDVKGGRVKRRDELGP